MPILPDWIGKVNECWPESIGESSNNSYEVAFATQHSTLQNSCPSQYMDGI